MPRLIALVAIAAGTYGPDQPAIAAGEVITQPLSPELQAKLIDDGAAKVEDEASNTASNGAADGAKPSKANDEAKTSSRAPKRAKVRLLVDSALGNCNDLVEVDASDVKKLESDGLADGGKEAIAYAQTLEQNQPRT